MKGQKMDSDKVKQQRVLERIEAGNKKADNEFVRGIFETFASLNNKKPKRATQ